MVSLPNLSRSTWFIIAIWVFVIVGVPAFFFVSGYIGPAVSNVVGDEPEQGTLQEVHPEPITGKANVANPRGIHIQNLADVNQTVTITINNHNDRIWRQSYNVSANSELEILNLIAKKGNYLLEINTESSGQTNERILIGERHEYIIVNIDSNSINVTQSID